MVSTIENEKLRTIVVSVNNNEVVISLDEGKPKATGAEIKAAAISQGVDIRPDFVLFVKHGSELKPVGDHETVVIHPHEKFIAVAPDDSSES